MAAVPLIHNPRAGGGRGVRLAKKVAMLLADEGVEVVHAPTSGPLDAGALVERLAGEGHEQILVLGGDGTISEAADGALRSKRDVTLGLLPGGTGNSLLRDFAPIDLHAAARRVARDEPRRIDAARASWGDGEARHFVNVFGTGFVAKVCALANERYKWMGHAAYSWAVFPELARLDAPMTRLTLDGRTLEEPFALVAVCNSVHTGGAMRIAPMARVDDGWLDVVALREVSRAKLLRLFPKIFRGSHVGDERVLVERARRIRIEPAEPSPLLGDGEVYGATPCEVEVLPGALNIVV